MTGRIVLFFCPSIDGHKIEFIHHLYEGALRDTLNYYVLIVPDKFNCLSQYMKWERTTNIHFDYISKEVSKVITHTKGFLKSWYLNKCLHSFIKEYHPSNVFLIDIVPYLPFLVFHGVRVSGIVYRIYPYGWKTDNKKKRVIEYLRQLILSRSSCVEKVFILNNEFGPAFFNRRFHTDKFIYLADPIPNNGELDVEFNLKNEYQIDTNKIVLLHPGGMLRYKGTLQILNSIELLSEDDRKKYCFVFAGRITEDIRDTFFQLFNRVKELSSVVLIQGYLSFERMNSLFSQSDFILIPYEPRLQSSGIIGIAALFNKPVITNRTGVVGKLVKHYKLGKLLRDNSAESISACLSRLSKFEKIDGSSYVCVHQVDDFINTVFSLYKD